jgi:hypothetical protein
MSQSGDCLKISKTVPIFKSGDKKCPDNYRPISIITSFSKIFEKLIYSRLRSFYEKNNFFHKHQYGFMPNSSTVSAALQLVEGIRASMNERLFTGAIFIDVSKAFDCVDHQILLAKLYKSGIRGSFHKLMTSYMSGRLQKVCLNGSESENGSINFGVFQGTILGPLLFLVYINDLLHLPLKGQIQLYADDVALLYSSQGCDDMYEMMQHDLNIIENWFYDNRLTANGLKTKLIIFKHPKKILSSSRTLFLGGQTVERVSEIRYLGLILDSRLTWYPHIDHIKSKIVPFVGILSKLKYYVPKHIRMQVYYAHIYSHISYLNPIWGGACKYKLKELERLVNKAVRSVFFEDYNQPNTHTVDLYSKNKLLSVKILCEYESVLLVHRLKHNTIRNDIFLPTNRETHNYNTRARNDFHLSRINNEFGRRGVHHNGILSYNHLPPHLKSISNYDLFKREVKRHMLARTVADYLI